MVKLPKCRICLVENVRMDVVVNKYLHEVYEKLTDIPFVTEDSRPILVCFVCCAQLKKCYRLRTKCLEAEERFAQIMNGKYEQKPLINQDHLELFHGFINSPIQSINIVDVGQNESMIVKEELPTDFQRLEDIIEPKEEPQSDDGLEAKNLYDNYLDIEYVPLHHSELDSEDDVPLMEFKTEAEDEQEVSENKRKAKKTNSLEAKNLYDNYLEIYIPPHHSEPDSEDDVPLMEFKTEAVEEQEVSENKRKSKKTSRAPVAKKPKLDTRRTKREDTVTPEIKKAALKTIQNTQKRTSTSFINTKQRVQNNSNQDVKRFECDTCHCSFSQKHNLTKHIRTHTGEKPYKCDICQRRYNAKSTLNNHMRIHTGEKPYKCDICHCSFGQKYKLTMHIRLHTGEKPFKCDVCPRSFRDKVHLTKHIRLHTGVKPYKCDVCQQCFRLEGTLRNHKRIHTGEKPYKCNVCQRSFAHKDTLRCHIRIHTGEKPYKCDVCQRSFARNTNLRCHIRIHSGEKPYKCDLCQRGFSSKFCVQQHMRIHTGLKSSKC